MTHDAHSPLVERFAAELAAVAERASVLDLACGRGRNGLFLARAGLPVTFADRSKEALADVERALSESDLSGECWEVDLEEPGAAPLAERTFSSVLVFRYLHRPLFPALRQAVIPGGLVVYETFTVKNRAYGRPSNPAFLLREGELRSEFQGWETLWDFEGLVPDPDREVAQLVARRIAL